MSAIMGSLVQYNEPARALPARPAVAPKPRERFGRELQLDVLALMTQSYHFLLCATEVLTPQRFQDDVLAFFFSAIRDGFRHKHSKPTSQDLWIAISRAAHAGRIQDAELCRYVEVFCQLRDPKPAAQLDSDDVVAFCLAAGPA